MIAYGPLSDVFDETDPDNDLLPLIVEKVLVPKLTGMIHLITYLCLYTAAAWTPFFDFHSSLCLDRIPSLVFVLY